MARMIPATISPDTASEAEKKVFVQLRDALDDSFTVFHSLDLLTRNKTGKLIDGEVDFVIFSREKGLLTLEVKGGVIRFDGGTSSWYQNDNRMDKSPYAQARDYKYKVKELLAQRLRPPTELPLGHAVCFPDIFSVVDRLPAEGDTEITLTGRELPYFNKAIPGIMADFNKDYLPPLTPEQGSAVRLTLAPVFEYGISLFDKVERMERTIFSLTQEQCRLLDFLGDRRQVLIQGCAGSGKTVMALKKARQFAREGKKVLLLAYNRRLAQHLSEKIAELGEAVEAGTYHKYCLSKLKEAGVAVEVPPQAGPEFWESEVPARFDALIRSQAIQYDAVIVDEGQDFRCEYWLTIEQLVKPDGRFYIFFDPDQNLYGTKMDFPISSDPFVLNENCRTTRTIFSCLKPHVSRDVALRDGAPDGEPVVELTADTPEKQRKNLAQILHNLVQKNHVPLDRIVILGGHSLKHTCLAASPNLGNFSITEDPDAVPNAVRYCTYMGYKGCEADVVILLDVSDQDDRWASPIALYTAKSRAKCLLYILKEI